MQNLSKATHNKFDNSRITHDLDEKLAPLVGNSAGAICRTLELSYVPPYKSVIDAASKIGYDQDLYMSAWLFVSQWQDGTTLWRESDDHANAQVTPDGKVNIQEIYPDKW